MDEHIFDHIEEVDLKKTMESSYIAYAMSVIASRALPDVRDGLKPVQRRILYSMRELGNDYDKPHKKCARIVGETMGKYHPHGDSSIYGALVNMAQEWSTRYMLVDGHGNFGSVDGDGAAAMRYTEARLSKISSELLADINKDTVDFIPNYDETEKEPVVLPSRYPNLLVNGTTGIAVGMATNIPPHNLREVIAAVCKIIDNKVEEDRDTTVEELIEIVKGPDFPTGAMILGRRGIEAAYKTGRGKIRVRAISNIEPMENGKNRIVVTELPYLVNKANLITKIAELHKDKKIDGITELRDESDQEGTRVVIELRRDANPNVILNQLYKHTQLQDSFGVIMLALVNNEPKVLNLREMTGYYLDHQVEVVTRRTKYDLNKAKERDHILQGLLTALDNIDEVISIIRASHSTADAKEKLMQRFSFSEAQAQAIVDMRLRALTGLERAKLEEEHKQLVALIEELTAILADEKKLLGVIKTELTEISDKYGDDRRTEIGYDEFDLEDEDLIPRTETIVTMTNLGYIKRTAPDAFRAQRRGGKGIKGMQTIEEDFVKEIFQTHSHDDVVFFTNTGRVYKLRAYEIPEASRTSRGTPIINLLNLLPGESITAMLPIKEYSEDKYLLMATKSGYVKKTALSDYANIRKNGLIAIALREGDDLIEVKVTDGESDIFLVTKKGLQIRFSEQEVRTTGRDTQGVIGMSLADDDVIVAMQENSEGEDILFVSELGQGKRTAVSEFKNQHRGGKGLICYKITEKTGDLIGAKVVTDENDIMLVTNEGIIIRMPVEGISVIGRNTSGVKLMNIDKSSSIRIASVAKTDKEEEEPEQEAEEE